MPFKSSYTHVGVLAFPRFTGTRVMMMPVRLEDADTVPMQQWRKPFRDLVMMSPVHAGVAYLTIDEALVRKGETHRRPGLHVDGIGPDGRSAAYGGGGGGYGSAGFLLASDVTGVRVYDQDFDGYPGLNGDCEHLLDETLAGMHEFLDGGHVYHLGPLTVHRAIPMTEDTQRIMVRLSMPNNSPWHEGYTRNPLGVEPTGPIHGPRDEFMGYRP